MTTTYHYFGNDYSLAYGLDHLHAHMQAWITLDQPVSDYRLSGNLIDITAPAAWTVSDGEGHIATQLSLQSGFEFIGVEATDRAGHLLNNIDFRAGWEFVVNTDGGYGYMASSYGGYHTHRFGGTGDATQFAPNGTFADAYNYNDQGAWHRS